MSDKKIKIVEFPPETLKQYYEDFDLPMREVVKYGEHGYCLPKNMDIDFIRNDFQVFPDDLWIVTPPKCGTTWMQEIVWLIHTQVDLKKSKYNQFYRIPFLELGMIRRAWPESATKPDNFEKVEKNEENVVRFMKYSLDYVQSLKRPRLIKTHLPFELLPKKLLDTAKVTKKFGFFKRKWI